jgi:hypothetical protein
MSKRRPKNEEELFKVVEEVWKNIDATYLKKLVESMPKRLEAVIAAKGNITKY